MSQVYEDVLEIIPENELKDICETVAQELPTSVMIHEYIKTSMKWSKTNPNCKIVHYRYRENLGSAIFVSIFRSDTATPGLYLHAKDGYENILKEVLLKTSKIPWTEEPIIVGVLPRHTEIVENVIKTKKFMSKLYADSILLFLNTENALKYNIKCPPDVYLANLTSNHVEFIYNYWPHKDAGTKNSIRKAIDSLSFGIFSKENNDLLSWVMHTHYCTISLLYTRENVRRKGYAKILVKKMSKELTKLRIQPFALVMKTNTKSVSLFQSLGFKPISLVKTLMVCME